jgi:NAD(P) transhydrogenase subunit beta
MSENFAAFAYLVSGVLFIMALRGLSHPTTSRQGNLYGMVGMAIAIVTTLLLAQPSFGGFVLIIAGLAIGGGAGAYIARKIAMTSMPQLVAGFHSLVGLAAVLVAAAALYSPHAFGIGEVGEIHAQALIEMSLGVAIGAITFTGSIIAFLKLDGRMSGKPIMLPMRHVINAALAIGIVVLVGMLVATESYTVFWLIVVLSLVLGVLIIVPIGGADMPVVVSMLNSYSGWAAAGIGFTLGNLALIITGALVGSSGAILSYIMCKGMNRSFISVILGGFGGESAAAGDDDIDRTVKQGSADDAAFLMERLQGDHRARLRHGGRPGAARNCANGRQAKGAGCRGEVRHPPGGRPHARPHERAAGRSERAL